MNNSKESINSSKAVSYTHLDVYKRQAKYIGISLEKAKRLGELINEFFEITRYNLQNITLDKKEFYLYVLLEQVMDSFAAVFKQKGLEWKIEVDDKILIYGDPDRLARVFENLLRNARCV